jgi:hypothetical protein
MRVIVRRRCTDACKLPRTDLYLADAQIVFELRVAGSLHGSPSGRRLLLTQRCVVHRAAAPGFTSACPVKGSSLFFQERWQTERSRVRAFLFSFASAFCVPGYLVCHLWPFSFSQRIHQESFHHSDSVVVVRGLVIEKPLRLISSATILGMLWRRAASRHFSFGTRSGNFEPRGTMRRSSARAMWRYTSYMLGLSVGQCWSRPTANISRTKVMVTAEM